MVEERDPGRLLLESYESDAVDLGRAEIAPKRGKAADTVQGDVGPARRQRKHRPALHLTSKQERRGVVSRATLLAKLRIGPSNEQ